MFFLAIISRRRQRLQRLQQRRRCNIAKRAFLSSVFLLLLLLFDFAAQAHVLFPTHTTHKHITLSSSLLCCVCILAAVRASIIYRYFFKLIFFYLFIFLVFPLLSFLNKFSFLISVQFFFFYFILGLGELLCVVMFPHLQPFLLYQSLLSSRCCVLTYLLSVSVYAKPFSLPLPLCLYSWWITHRNVLCCYCYCCCCYFY